MYFNMYSRLILTGVTLGLAVEYPMVCVQRLGDAQIQCLIWMHAQGQLLYIDATHSY